MNRATWDELIDRIRAVAVDDDAVRVAGAVSDADIAAVEQLLGEVFPADYREFLRAYGMITVTGSTVYGIWPPKPLNASGHTVLWETQRMREGGMPGGFIAIREIGYTQCLCLDTVASEGPRLCFYSTSDRRFYPCDWAETFAEHFTWFLEYSIELAAQP